MKSTKTLGSRQKHEEELMKNDRKSGSSKDSPSKEKGDERHGVLAKKSGKPNKDTL